MHTGPATGRGGGRCAEFFGAQHNGEVHVRQGQAQCVGLAAIDASKGIHAAGTYAQLFHGHWVFGFILVRRARQVGQGDGAVQLFNGKAAGDLEETHHVHCEVAAGAGQLALGAVHAQGQAGGLGSGAGLHRQATGSKVDQRAFGVGAVDFEFEGIGRQSDVVQAQHLCAGRAGLQSHPGAGCGFGLGLSRCELLAQQHQAKVHITQ